MTDDLDEDVAGVEDDVDPEGLREAELMQARAMLQRLVGRTIRDLRVEETRIALTTDDDVTYYFYGFMGEDVPE